MFRDKEIKAFTLVEVVIALGLMVFGIIVVLGLLSVVLETNRESKGQLGAADTASHMVAARRAAPTNTVADLVLPVINQDWNATKGTGYVSSDGKVATASQAAFYATYQVGTNVGTGTRAGDVDVVLSWPAAAAANAQNHYEIFTTVSW
jgi:Tfp pilus assembly protein PilV